MHFKPKLIEALVGYNRERLFKDIAAGITVGVVALPLAMAFAIASGLTPEAGLFTAILSGLIISVLGGSRVQIGGPAGAFIVIVYGILTRYGLANLIIATAMSGVMLLVMGLLRLGSLIRFVPVAVVIGFTNGIAVLIMVSQLKDFLGLRINAMPADFFGILSMLSHNIASINTQAFTLALACLFLLVVWQLVLPRVFAQHIFTKKLSLIPGSMLVLVLGTLATSLLGLDIETIASRFDGIPNQLPSMVWPDFTWQNIHTLLLPAATLALLGAIESLLCARIADQMMAQTPYGDRHDANQELMAQGIANIVTPFFGGMPATGTIARTVTNVKNGGNTPIAGIVHALTLLMVVWIAAPLAGAIPLAVLSAILMFVAWNMGEWREFVHLRQFRLPYRATLLAVFVLTVVVDLTVAVEVGLIAACLTFIFRISRLSRAEAINIAIPNVLAYRLNGALFFAAVALVENIEDKLPSKAVVLDLSSLLYIDSSGADALQALARTCKKKQVRLIVCSVSHQPLDILRRCGLLAKPCVERATDWADAMKKLEKLDLIGVRT
jgi:SulP family sulfate permease